MLFSLNIVIAGIREEESDWTDSAGAGRGGVEVLWYAGPKHAHGPTSRTCFHFDPRANVAA